MDKLYVPLSGKAPVKIEVNGHQVVLVSPDHDALVRGLGLLGGDSVLEFDPTRFGSPTEALEELSDVTGHAHVVLAPVALEVPELLENLRHSLPWLH